MKTQIKFICGCILLSCLATAANAQAPVGRWNLGEDDPGAVPGNPGNGETSDAISTNGLVSFGTPVYTENTVGGGSTLAMSFDGASFYQGSVVANEAGFDKLYGNLDFSNFSLSCDVYMTAVGPGGFSFPLSMGRNTGGLAPVEVGGKWHLIHKSVANSAAGPDVVLNAWTHLDIVRTVVGSTVASVLYIDGVPAITNSARLNLPTDFLTIGANELGSGVPGDVEGLFQGLVDNVVITNLSLATPPKLVVPDLAVSPGTIYTGNSIILTAGTLSGDPSGLTYLWRKEGNVVTNTGAASSVTFANATGADSGAYDLVVTNNYGSTTSAVATVTVLDASYSGGKDAIRFRMGDDDPGAADGSLGNAVTKDAVGTNDLGGSGTPIYSGNIPVGGGALSLSFDGGSGFYRGTDMTDFYAGIDLQNFSLSCDVYVTALGSAGFSFPVSMGNGAGGFSIVEIGGNWRLVHQGSGQSATGYPVELGTWTHLELQRRQFGSAVRSRLFVNGVDVGVELTAGPSLPIAPVLTVGANTLGDGENVEGYFSGEIDNVVVHDYSVGTQPVLTGFLAVPATTLLAGESLTLVASAQGGSPLVFNWKTNGVTAASTVAGGGVLASVTFTDLAPEQSGSYTVEVTNLAGSTTSAAVIVTVLPPGSSRPGPSIRYRLGEDDPGATAGSAGNAVTANVNGSMDLTANGTPIYDANVPPGGSTLSMSFDGASYYEGTGDAWTTFYSGFDVDHCSLSCDVYVNDFGATGFSFPLSVGGGGTGFGIVEVGGKWHCIENGVALSPAGPDVQIGTWTHLEMLRTDFGSGVETRLFVDGVDTGAVIKGAPIPPANRLWIGANQNNGAPEGYFNGLVDNVDLHSFTATAPVLNAVLQGGEFQVDCAGYSGGTYTLWRTPSLSPVSWTSITNGTADATGHVLLVDPAPLADGAFYRTSSP